MDVELNGIRLHYDRRGNGSPVLLLHGGTGFGADWKHVFPHPPKGMELITPDLRGHGRSLNPARTFTIPQIAEDVLALLDHLSISVCRAIGMSLGAKTLLHVAAMRPEQIEAMVLVSATPYFPASARKLMAQATPESYDKDQLNAMREKHSGGDDQILALWQQMHALKDSYDDMNFTPPLLGKIQARTLIVHGDSDPLYPVEMANELYRSIPRSNLWVVPGGGHVPIFDDICSNFAQVAIEFLGSKAS